MKRGLKFLLILVLVAFIKSDDFHTGEKLSLDILNNMTEKNEINHAKELMHKLEQESQEILEDLDLEFENSIKMIEFRLRNPRKEIENSYNYERKLKISVPDTKDN